jgi:glutathionylspermidine synthase
VRKPLLSREGANIELFLDGRAVAEEKGHYGAEGFIRQALAPLPNFSNQYPVLGSWLIDRTACGLSIPARTKIRSQATRRVSCRTRSCDAWRHCRASRESRHIPVPSATPSQRL